MFLWGSIRTYIHYKPLHDKVKNRIKEHSIENAKENLNELQAIIKNKNNHIEALSLILDIFENSQLIINKIILSKEDELTHFLTDVNLIELINDELDTRCCMFNDKLTHVIKILIHKGDDILNFKYSFSNCVQLLENDVFVGKYAFK